MKVIIDLSLSWIMMIFTVAVMMMIKMKMKLYDGDDAMIERMQV